MKTHRSYSDHEIASYVLGLDMPDRAIDIQARLAHDDAAAARALKWETYFLGIADALPPAPPPAELLMQIQATLGMENAPITEESRQPQQPADARIDDAASTSASAARPRTRTKHLSKRRLLLAVGVIAAILVIIMLVWASLKPLPDSTVVQQPLHLEAK
ncbi:hypothetical protein [Castellaniella sp.]|uniref:hypothetical protein n=1 Tax=Castellaniella sp. TaxID=1955812 RepID=UPI002AFF54E2|nr:hypothetical protein [Castellaniella sp.]